MSAVDWLISACMVMLAYGLIVLVVALLSGQP